MKKLLVVSLVVAAALLGIFAVAAQDTPGTIADIVVASAGGEMPEFATLLAAVQAADPAVLEALSDAEAELTVFAPTDAAFAATTAALGEEASATLLADPAALANILLYHVMPGTVYSGDLVEAMTMEDMPAEDMMPEWLVSRGEDGSLEVLTAQGATATISATEEGMFINKAQISATNVDAANGVIHVISAVILPPTE